MHYVTGFAGKRLMKKVIRSSVVKRSIVIAGHKTSVSLENEFWHALKEIATDQGMALSELVAAINANRQHANLSSAIRQYVLAFYRDQVSDHEDGARIA
jgi:predicted DNA-binding ribbon-helix-helix protein